MSQLVLRNPHSVLAVFETRPKDVVKVQIPSKASNESWAQVATLAKQNATPVAGPNANHLQHRNEHQKRNANFQTHSQKKGGRPAADESSRMGAAEVTIKERTPVSIEEIFSGAKERANGRGLWLALDQVQDPQNVGAIFRAAAFFGVQGVILMQDRSASLTSTVYDVASGGMEYVPFAIITNMKNALEKAKEAGVWILGTSEHAHDDINGIPQDRPWLLVVGNEEKGIRRLTEESCDMLCRISGKGGVSSSSSRGRVTSLNVSVAVGVMISKLA